MDEARREALERSVEQRRAELGSALRVLRQSAVQRTPGERFRRDPYPWLAVAAGIGLWLALRQGAPGEPS